MKKKLIVSVLGLGYVGLPLAIEFGKVTKCIGFDLNKTRIKQLKKFYDTNHQIHNKNFNSSKYLLFTNNISLIKESNFYIVTVPTPINKNNTPDLKLLIHACKIIAKVISINNIVIFESTFYPGLTEEICIPIIEKYSRLKAITENNKKIIKEGFYYGYSPERINPGDKSRTLKKIVKLTSGSTKNISKYINKTYRLIISNTYQTSSIKVAETAKVIENSQRDINIALMNELSILCNKLNISSKEVLDAAKTKWNFLNFSPGLVGGHCISVDPYYLSHKAKKIGFKTNVILSGRKVNDNMGQYVFDQILNFLKLNIKKPKDKINILIIGATFKENCPDLRNSQVYLIWKKLFKSGFKIEIYDPIANNQDFFKIYEFNTIKNLKKYHYDLIVICVPHKQIIKMGISKILSLCKTNSKNIFDLKSVFKSKYIKFTL